MLLMFKIPFFEKKSKMGATILSQTYLLDIDSFHIKNIKGNSNLNRLTGYSRRT